MSHDFDDVAGMLEVPSLDHFDEDSLKEDEHYFAVRNYGLSIEKKYSLIDPDPYRPTGVSDQSFQYVMVDFANRHGLEATIAKGNSIILAGSRNIPKLMREEFGDKFHVEQRGMKFLKIMLKRMKKKMNDDKNRGNPPELHYNS